MGVTKFRVWDEDAQEMVYGVGLTPEGIPYSIPAYAEASDQFNYFPDSHIMQFTGLRDKNGVEIYEGDNVRLTNESGFASLGEVQFNDGCFEVKFQSGLPIFNGARHQYTKYQDYVKVFAANHAIEVVGNIYQNPYLLKEEAR
ncbi:YopX family protein [Bacillus sp. 1735sda2]|uniref:YopX family protein n=1 Tax=Bacillus sp. 1735sda2 TaxID=2953806 RepID=UPI00209C8A14|nr:YopX family protein [Bacillus sp. 1735sda2]MCP1147930.1 YopX family protein [Bacillus sp. 1735sda2]